MPIHARVERLLSRLSPDPVYETQGQVLFVDLAARTLRSGYIPRDVYRTFLGNRGTNMFLLYNLMTDAPDPLDPDTPLIFGAGPLTGNMPGATRGNVTGISPDSDALLDCSCGDYFPSFMRKNGYDHIVLYGRAAAWTLLKFADTTVEFLDAGPYVGLDNMAMAEAIERDFDCRESRTMAMARITTAGENGVLCSGIMGGPKAIWARGGAGAKMGSLNLKAMVILGKPPVTVTAKDYKRFNKGIGKKILSTSVIENALKKVGTPFLYKPSRVLGTMGAKNHQETTWVESLDADNIDPYRSGMAGCFQCPVRCRALNDMTPDGKGGFGASALKGLKGNASYDKAQADIDHHKKKSYSGINGDGVFDRYDHGDGPEYVTLGKFGPDIGVKEVEQVLRLNNILNDLGLDSASTGSAIAWAMELFQRGLITTADTGGLDLGWGNYPVIERLLFMTAKREGFGDVIAESARAVAAGKYPAEALDYRMASKGLFQSDPHDSRVLKAFALGLAVATRGMDHLRNRVTLEINARINDDAEFKTRLYGGTVAAAPNAYDGKEFAVRTCENTFAAGDSVGMCRFNTKLFNSPSLPDPEDFAHQLSGLTGIVFTTADIDEAGRQITGLERIVNFRLGLRAADDTLPARWFTEEITVGPFAGEKIDRTAFEDLKARFYALTGLNAEGLPQTDWHLALSRLVTGFAVRVDLPTDTPGAPEQTVVIDAPVDTAAALRRAIAARLPEAADRLADPSLNLAINDTIVIAGEAEAAVGNGDTATLFPMIGGG